MRNNELVFERKNHVEKKKKKIVNERKKLVDEKKRKLVNEKNRSVYELNNKTFIKNNYVVNISKKRFARTTNDDFKLSNVFKKNNVF